MEQNFPVWFTIISSILSAIGGSVSFWIANFYFKKKEIDHQQNKETRSLQLTENLQAVEIYKDIIKTLKEDIIKLGQELNELEKIYLHSQIENAQLKTQLEFLTKKK